MNFNDYLAAFKNKTDVFFNAQAQCYDSGKDSQLLLYADIEKQAFYEFISQYEEKKLFENTQKYINHPESRCPD